MSHNTNRYLFSSFKSSARKYLVQFNVYANYWWYFCSAAIAFALGPPIRILRPFSTAIWAVHGEIRIKFDGPASPSNSRRHVNNIGLHTFESLASDLLERLFYTDPLLRRRLIKRNPVVSVAPLFSFSSIHFSFTFSINFVSKHDEGEGFGFIWGGIIDKALLPFCQVLKSFTVRDIINENTAISSSIEGIAEGLELFLTRSVPNLEGHHLVINESLFLWEIGTDGWLSIACDLSI